MKIKILLIQLILCLLPVTCLATAYNNLGVAVARITDSGHILLIENHKYITVNDTDEMNVQLFDGEDLIASIRRKGLIYNSAGNLATVGSKKPESFNEYTLGQAGESSFIKLKPNKECYGFTRVNIVKGEQAIGYIIYPNCQNYSKRKGLTQEELVTRNFAVLIYFGIIFPDRSPEMINQTVSTRLPSANNNNVQTEQRSCLRKSFYKAGEGLAYCAGTVVLAALSEIARQYIRSRW